MFGLFSSRNPAAAAPATVPTDTVIPRNAADDTVFRSVCVVLSYGFDDVLVPEEL